MLVERLEDPGKGEAFKSKRAKAEAVKAVPMCEGQISEADAFSRVQEAGSHGRRKEAPRRRRGCALLTSPG